MDEGMDPGKEHDKKKKGKKNGKKAKSTVPPPIPPTSPIPPIDLDPVRRLTRDLRSAAVTLSDREARFLVDSYYLMQENRKRGRAQERALNDTGEPHTVISWFADQSDVLERQIERALDAYSWGHLTGDWVRNVFGVGPVLAAGFQAFVYMGDWCEICHAHSRAECQVWQDEDIKEKKMKPEERHEYREVYSCPTAGRIWSFAGIAGDNQKKWEKGTKRPWNATLKTLCWKFSDVAVKFSNNERCYYGHLYRERKERETFKNTRFEFKHIAEERLNRPKTSKEASYHKQGILSPGHIELRARRYAAKRFISDLHTVWYWKAKKELPPIPYPLAYMPDKHTRYVAPIAAMPDLWAALKKQHGL